MHLGQLALHPYYRLSEDYDSNIYLVPRDQPGGQAGSGVRGSWITRNELGLEARLPWHRLNALDLGYDFEADRYSFQPSVNDTINQSAHADFAREGAQGLAWRIGDRYENTTDQAFSELVQRQRRWMNRAYAAIEYRPRNGRLAGGVDVDHQADKYLDPTVGSGLNRYQQDAGADVGWMIQPKTKAYVAYHRGIVHYTVRPAAGVTDKNSKSHIVTGGVDGQLTPKISGRVEAGMTQRAFDEAPAPGASRVSRALVVSTAVTYKPAASTTAVLRVSRALQASIDPANPFYYENDVSLDLEHRFPRKLRAGLGAAMGVNQYLNAQTVGATTARRRDDLYQGGVWVQCDVLQWLSTGLSYVYRERDSTFTGEFDYQDQRTAWNATLRF